MNFSVFLCSGGGKKQKQGGPDKSPTRLSIIAYLIYFRKEISTPAATADPMTPEILDAIQ